MLLTADDGFVTFRYQRWRGGEATGPRTAWYVHKNPKD